MTAKTMLDTPPPPTCGADISTPLSWPRIEPGRSATRLESRFSECQMDRMELGYLHECCSLKPQTA